MEKEINFEQELYKAFGQVKDFTLSMQIAKWFYEMGKNSQEPVSEELETEIEKYLNALYRNWTKKDREKDADVEEMCRQTARHFAKWQKNKMMEDAVDGVVAASAGGEDWVNIATGFVKSSEVNVKFGDKIKIIIIKNDEL